MRRGAVGWDVVNCDVTWCGMSCFGFVLFSFVTQVCLALNVACLVLGLAWWLTCRGLVRFVGLSAVRFGTVWCLLV